VQLREGWDTYLSTLDGKKLRNLRSRRRKIDGDSQWKFRLVDRPSELDHAWSAVLEVEQGSWKHSQGSSLVSERRAGAFYRMVAERAATAGQLRLHLLEHAGAPVAYALGVVERGTYFLLKNSYRDAFKSWSPGMCLVWHAMTEAATTGCNTLDFLGDIHDWKRDFATALPEYVTCTVYPSGTLRCHGCRVVEETVKPLARRLGITRLMGRVRGA
jgi:CelD/BcsL family acetyltransferase involved in cellulose biosynthesis